MLGWKTTFFLYCYLEGVPMTPLRLRYQRTVNITNTTVNEYALSEDDIEVHFI